MPEFRALPGGGIVPMVPDRHTVNEVESPDEILQVATDVIDTLADLIQDVLGNEMSRSALAKWMQDYEEELIVLRQRLKEATQ